MNNANTPTDEPLTVDAMRPKHRCQPIARAVAMEEGRDWWIGELIEPVPEWPHETHCLHMKTPIKYVVFLCNSGDFEQLLVMSNVVTQLKNLQWLESMTEMAITRAGNDPDHGFTAEEIAEFEKAEDRVDAWLQTKGVEIARAAAIKAAASGPRTCGHPECQWYPHCQHATSEFPAATTSAMPPPLDHPWTPDGDDNCALCVFPFREHPAEPDVTSAIEAAKEIVGAIHRAFDDEHDDVDMETWVKDVASSITKHLNDSARPAQPSAPETPDPETDAVARGIRLDLCHCLDAHKAPNGFAVEAVTCVTHQAITAALTSTRSQLLKQIREAVEAVPVFHSAVARNFGLIKRDDALAAIDRVANETSET